MVEEPEPCGCEAVDEVISCGCQKEHCYLNNTAQPFCPLPHIWHWREKHWRPDCLIQQLYFLYSYSKIPTATNSQDVSQEIDRLVTERIKNGTIRGI